jgi:uncharacterized integral membrane protein
MTYEREPHRESSGGTDEQRAAAAPELERPRTWILPLLWVALLVVPVVILVLSNTDSREVGFAGFTWEAPMWIILAITFVAGALLTRLVGWTWNAIRRRSKKRLAEYDRARREAAGG